MVAVNGAEAWRLLENTEYPVVISDWMMPEMDGLELIRRIRARAAARYVYTLLLTARSQKEDVVEGMEAGADDFVTKPFDRDELRVRLRAAERILGLEHSLAEQTRILRETEAALTETDKLVNLAGHLTDWVRELDTTLQQAISSTAAIRPQLDSALVLLAKGRSILESLPNLAPALAVEIAQSAAELGSIQQNLTEPWTRSGEAMAHAQEFVRALLEAIRLSERPA
jgi:CheY-like chemotaxis protein